MERKILHYVDPMNPALKSDKPGIAPCGMPLVPVYADQNGAIPDGTEAQASLPPGTIRISSEKQQLIGVKVITVEKSPWSHTIRALGRVVPDETRVYRINAAVSGLIKDVRPITTGSLVKENELLATFYSSLEYRALIQSYFNSLKLIKSGPWNTDGEGQASPFSKSQLAQMKKTARDLGQTGETFQINYYKRSILNTGISAYQLEEMERTGTIPEEIEIRSPAAGFIVLRNVTDDYRFDKGAELFRIANLSRVWILADVFENESSFFNPGLRVKMELPYQKKTLHARMSNVLPQFDPTTRTLKIRLEAENPGYAMRPDMFVNVEIPVSGTAAIIVPIDAIVDSGLKKTVFVDRGSGYFEPRQVETGRSLGERVEITQGLMPGEKIVVSGNFLIDSETRMQQAAAGIMGKIGRDPVCRMNIDEDRAKAAGHFLEYKDKTYYFCEPQCQEDFRKEPERYLKPAQERRTMPMTGSKDIATKHDHPEPAAGPKPRGAKAAHERMSIPSAEKSPAMPGMPGAVTAPGARPMTTPRDAAPMPKMKEGAMPSAGGVSGMEMDSPSRPGPEGMTMTRPKETPPMSGAQMGEIAPAPADSTPKINPRFQRDRPGTAPQAGGMPPPTTDTPR